MDRRGFLKALATTATALGYAAIAPDALVALTSPTASQAVVEQATRKTLEWVTGQVARHVSELVGPLTLVESDDINPQTAHQSGVNLELITHPMSHDAYEQRYVMPIAAALANAMQDDRATVCGTLPLPVHAEQGCVVTHQGLSVRGLQYYAFDIDSHQLRFEVLYG